MLHLRCEEGGTGILEATYTIFRFIAAKYLLDRHKADCFEQV